MQLPSMHEEFVLHFGEMGSRWGINRTVGQIYALLFLGPDPINADQIVEQLGISRSNVSMGLKELQAWNLVRLRRLPGDRRDYFTTPEDVWVIVRTLLEERKKREVDPTLSQLRALQMREPATDSERQAQARIGELGALIELLSQWYSDINRLETSRLVQLLEMGAKVNRVIDSANAVVNLPGRRTRAAAGSKKEG